MSLFGDSPTETPLALNRSRISLFDDEIMTKSQGNSLFQDDDPSNTTPGGTGTGSDSPWAFPTPRKQQSRAEMVRSLLPAGADVPDAYVDTFDAVLRSGDDGEGVSTASGKVGAQGIARTLASAKLGVEDQARIMTVLSPGGGVAGAGSSGGELAFGRAEFNVLLALIGLAQEGETVSLDSVDERRRNLPIPKLPGLVKPRAPAAAAGSASIVDSSPFARAASELAAKPPQRPVTPPSRTGAASSTAVPPTPPPKATPNKTRATVTPRATVVPNTMSFPDAAADDPWNTPDLHKGHGHGAAGGGAIGRTTANGSSSSAVNGADTLDATSTPIRTTSTYTTSSAGASDVGGNSDPSGPVGTWGYYGAGQTVGGGDGTFDSTSPDGGSGAFGGNGTGGPPRSGDGTDNGPGEGSGGGAGGGSGGGVVPPVRSLGGSGSGRTGNALEENILVTLMPEKEGMFMFQHHNYEVASARRGSKVIRRYSDFVWLQDCLLKRYPFRVLPLLPPKRVAVNGNHLSNDGAFIEKRRRGLARFLNALVRHPVLGQEQLAVMFLTVPTELSGWRKQATISVQDEFTGRALTPGLEDSLPIGPLNELFARTRQGVRRSSDLYISVCNVMDRLVKRTEGVAADHARVAVSLTSLAECSADVYATDPQDVPLLNDGLGAMAKHLRQGQTLLEDESRAWERGVLEDLKRQRDALVSLREMFDRKERLDRDTIPMLENRIKQNEQKLEALRNRPDGVVKPGEMEKLTAAIIRDKGAIVDQHNRSVFVRECVRDELMYFQQTQYHVSRWHQDWAQERVKYAELLADNWRRLLDELDGMPLGD